jgi:hypothetical protein
VGPIYDSGANLSDHRPLVACFQFDNLISINEPQQHAAERESDKHSARRRDQADLAKYYELDD